MNKYIHRKSIGDFDECQTAMRLIGEGLYRLSISNDIKYGSFFIQDEITCDLDIQEKYKVPFVITVININERSNVNLEELVIRLDLEKI